MILYKFQGVTPIIDPETGNVIRWVIGLRATDSEDPTLAAYVDSEVPVPEEMQKPRDQWTEEEIFKFAMDYAVKEEYTEGPETKERQFSKENWFLLLKRQVEAQRGQPIRGSAVVI